MPIDISLNRTTINITFKSREYWNEIKDIVSSYSKWNSEKKVWIHKICGQTKKFIEELKQIDIIFYENTSEQILIDMCNKLGGIKFIRRRFREDLLKEPPIEGKSPYQNFQIEDIKRFISTNRLANGNDLGTGKSYEMSVVLSHLFYDKLIDKALIICPNHLVYDWKYKLSKFFWFKIDPYIVDIDNRYPFDPDLGIDTGIVIMSYRSLLMLFDDALKQQDIIIKKDKKRKKKEMKDISIGIENWGTSRCIIADEASCIKGNSLQKSCIDNIQELFEYRYPLSGTFAPNKVEEYYPLIHFLDSNLMPMNEGGFLRWIGKVGNAYSKNVITEYYPEKVQEFLTKYVHPYITRRKANEVLNLPEMVIENIYCNMSIEHLRLYQSLTIEVLKQVKETDNGFITIKTIENKFPYVLEAVSNPLLLKDKFLKDSQIDKLINEFKPEYNKKLDILSSLFEKHIDENNEKIILWSLHPVTIESLKLLYKKYSPIVVHGDVGNKRVKQDLVDTFCNNEENKILIANPDCLAQGVTINEATVMINFDYDFDYETYEQKIKRFYRYGQLKNVILYNIIFDNTIENYVIDCLDKKKDLNKFTTEQKYLDIEECRKLFTGKI